MKYNKILWTVLCLLTTLSLQAQHEDERYVPDPDSSIQQRIREWQNLKFGLLMHWGTYSQWGIVESWSLCPEEYGWCERKKGSNPQDYNTYVKEYEALQHTFNPVKFNPDLWAKAAHDAGMRYVVFTTKHHDGFCMFNTKYTSYKVSDTSCPYHSNPRSNIAGELFKSFRKEGLWTGAYFSKPDWHSPYYWDPYYPPRDRNVNYEPEANPEKWEQYIQFTHNQVMELMSDYGKMDILWLDGGWVAKENKQDMIEWYNRRINEGDHAYLKHRVVNQDIRMDELVKKARSKQPQLIVVDRAVYGKNQNYLTPENRVPDKPLPYPWESCIISGGGWSYTPGAKYMSGREGIQLLVDIVAKGGNLLLNIAPSPEGEWQQGAYDLLKEYAAWMKVNSNAIYGTQAMAPYKQDNICFSQKENKVFLYYMCKAEENSLPADIIVKGYKPSAGAKITLLGNKQKLSWKQEADGLHILIPESMRLQPPCKYVWTFCVE